MDIWVSRDQIIARLRLAGFKFSTQTGRVEIWRASTKQRIDVQKRDRFPEIQARLVLKQAGLTKAEIDAFLKECVKS